MKSCVFHVLLAFPGCLFSESIPAGTGVVSAASYSAPVAPGSLITIFGSNLATVTESAAPGVTPLPATIGGTSVSIDGLPAPLLFVSPGQINAQMPAGVSISPDLLTTANVAVTSPMGTIAPATASTFVNGPAAFTLDSSGCGQAAALNVTPSGASSLNSPDNSAAPGDYVEIFGTGLGVLDQQPADGTASAGADRFYIPTAVSIGSDVAPVVFGRNPGLSSAMAAAYSGAAPTLVGVDQINFQIPAGTRNGCAVPLLLTADGVAASPVVTLSINANRGACLDPPQRSYGRSAW